jgi:hypothetical protein
VSVPKSPDLKRLVDDGLFDALLREVTLSEVARAWMRYQHREHEPVGPDLDDPGIDDPDWWAVSTWMDEDWWADEARVRTGILELVAAAETDSDFGILGAAVIEMFIVDDDDRVLWLEEQAGASEAFRRSLANVWIWGEVQDDIAARVEAAAGVRLKRPKFWKGR